MVPIASVISKKLRKIEGEEAYHFLQEYAKRKENMPFMVDILNCQKGCIYGTATEPERNTDDVLMTLSKMRTIGSIDANVKKKKKKSTSPWVTEGLTPEERLANLMKSFSKLDLNDFIRHYENKQVAY